MIVLRVNGRRHEVDVPKEMPLLWVLRDRLQLLGTKFGCGIGVCGACTVHVDGKAERSCQVQVGDAAGHAVTTIEGLSEEHPVVHAWIEDQVPQCGFCQPGQVMQATALLSERPRPTDQEISDAMDGNLCRCGTYRRIHGAIRKAAKGGAR